MNVSSETSKENETEALAGLRRFARPRPLVERCELCGADLESDHPHLLNSESRQIACGCNACAVLFATQERSKYLRIPRRLCELQDFSFTDLEGAAMMLPIHLAFFIRGADKSVAAMYPSPAGAVQSQLGMELLQRKFAEHKELITLAPEVETLLVNRTGDGSYFIAPIDECYRLVGLIRTKWKGLSGGVEVWTGIEQFFLDLKQRSAARRIHA
jgi:hypothetical protein